VSAIGGFQLAEPPAIQGPGTLTIRPEAIALQRGAVNGLGGTVSEAHYLGAQMRYHVRVGNLELQSLADAASGYRPGDTVALTLPPERLWVLPPADEQE
jgi:ABC-type Fe3+/spermidine/putrescine transport system ATPase subunit